MATTVGPTLVCPLIGDSPDRADAGHHPVHGMTRPAATRAAGWLPPTLLAYALASLCHHVHNATRLAAYPNLPASLTGAQVYLAWGLVTAVGVLGCALLRLRHARAGLACLGAYAVLGFAGLDHYARAPVSAHSRMMNLTIGGEVFTAAVLLTVVAWNLSVPPHRGASRES